MYAKSRILLDRAVDVLLFLPTLLLVFWMIGIPAWGALATLIMFTSVRLIGEAFNMWMFKKVGKHCGDKPLSYFLAIPYYLTPIFIPYFFGNLDLVAFFGNPLAVIVALLAFVVAGILALTYIKGYSLHMQLLRDKLHKYEVIFEKYQAAADGGATLAVAKKWDKGLEIENLEVDKFKNKKGFAYLNAIFFDRHKKFFAKKMWLRVLILLVPLAAAILLSVYSLVSSDMSAAEIVFGGNGDSVDLDALFRLTPAFFFIISIASMGRIVTLSIFSNCDIHMLHYPYYRTAETILASFKARFSATLRYNFIVTTVTFISIIGGLTLVLGYMDLMSAALFFVAITFIGAFFSFSDLFLYYIIQPYDSGGKDKSMLHKIINFVISALAWMSIQDINVDIELVQLTIFVAIIVTLYIGVGTVLLHRIAPKRFKLR